MRGISNIRIGVKIQITTITVILLFALFAVAVLLLRTALTAQVSSTVTSTEAALKLNGLGNSLQAYVGGTSSFEALQKEFNAFQETMKAKYTGVLSQKLSLTAAQGGGTAKTATLQEYIDGIWVAIGRAEALTLENESLESEVITLTGDAISQSNKYLSSISDRLSDPLKQKKVSVLERRVIQGASINTNSNYIIQGLFKDMRISLANKDKLTQFLDEAEKNATVDVERLAGTDFAQLPKDSVAAIIKTRELAGRFVQNASDREQIIAQITGELAGVIGGLNSRLVQDTRESFHTITTVMNSGLIFFALFIALVVVLQIIISRSITSPIMQTVRLMKEIEKGNFDVHAEVKGRDEAGQMLTSLNAMVANVSAMIRAVQHGSEQLASSSEEITASAQKLAEGAQSQASTLEQTSASVEELTASVDQVAEHAQSQSAAVSQGSRTMQQVHQSIQEVSQHLEEIAGLARASVDHAREGATAVSEVVNGIGLIAGSSERIGGIVTVIGEIADQTNLLALNASIEAARAGEHGRGFAVVADEVSKLADRSSSSTKEIEGLIRESVKNVTSGVNTAKGSQTAMEQIRAASEKVQEMITGLSASIKEQVSAVTELAKALSDVAEMSQSISAATEEQTTNAKQVSTAVENVNDVTQSAAASAEQMSVSTEQLSRLAQELQAMAGKFKVRSNGSAEPAVEALALSVR